MTEIEARQHWEHNAEDWIALTRSDPHYEVFNKPKFLEFLPAPGRLTVDVGCGEGRLSRELAKLGHRVCGFDGSPSLAAAGRRLDPSIPVTLADVIRLPIASQTADLVVCFMVLMDIEDLDVALAELARLLTPDGLLCFAIMHPIFSSGLFIPGDEYRTFYMGEYLRSMRHLLNVERPAGGTMAFRIEHRPMECYSRALEAAGLAAVQIREPQPSDDVVASEPILANMQRVPEFLYVAAQPMR